MSVSERVTSMLLARILSDPHRTLYNVKRSSEALDGAQLHVMPAIEEQGYCFHEGLISNEGTRLCDLAIPVLVFEPDFFRCFHGVILI